LGVKDPLVKRTPFGYKRRTVVCGVRDSGARIAREEEVMLSRWQQWGLLGVVLLASALLLVGCGRNDAGEKVAEGLMEKMLEQGSGGDVDVDLGGGDDVTVTTEEGTTTMSETTEWPSDMFEGVPQFTYGVVERVTRSDRADGNKAFMVYIRDMAADGPENYKKDMEAAGWQSMMSTAAGAGGMINAQKGNVALSLTYNNEDKTAVVTAYTVE